MARDWTRALELPRLFGAESNRGGYGTRFHGVVCWGLMRMPRTAPELCVCVSFSFRKTCAAPDSPVPRTPFEWKWIQEPELEGTLLDAISFWAQVGQRLQLCLFMDVRTKRSLPAEGIELFLKLLVHRLLPWLSLQVDSASESAPGSLTLLRYFFANDEFRHPLSSLLARGTIEQGREERVRLHAREAGTSSTSAWWYFRLSKLRCRGSFSYSKKLTRRMEV